MSVQVSKKKQVIFGIIVLVIILGVLEAAANVWLYEINTCNFEESEIYDHLDESEKRILCLENFELQFTDVDVVHAFTSGTTTTISSKGFRGVEFEFQKPENTFRIFTVGGSTTFGASVIDEHTFPYYLQKKFDDVKLDFNVEVINAGLGGAWSETETNLVKGKILYYEPDMVIVYDGWNEFDHGDKNALHWKDRWSELCNLGNEYGFKTIVTIQPFVGTGNKILTQYELLYLNEGLSYLEPYEEFTLALDMLNEDCAKTADIRTLFDSYSETIYLDSVHVGPQGNQIVAEKLFELSLPIVQETGIRTESRILDKSRLDQRDDNSNNAFQNIFSIYKTPRILAHLIDNSKLSSVEQNIPDELNFKGKDLSNEDFSAQDLKNAQFQFAKLDNVNFENANLKEADFSFAKLNNINFQNSDLENAKFSHSLIIKSDFSGANLANAVINLAEIHFSDFTNSDLKNAKVRGTDFTKPIFHKTNFENTDFTRSHLFVADFTTSNILGTIFIGTDIYASDFKGMDLTSTTIHGAAMKPTIFSQSDLSGTKLNGVDLTNVDFSAKAILLSTGVFYAGGANLTFVDLRNSDLSNTLFSTCNNLECATMFKPDLSYTNLSGVDLSNKNLMGVLFINADLTGTNLNGADLRITDLTGAILNDAELLDANLEGAILDGAILDCFNHPICN